MSQENVEAFERGLAAFNRRDLDALLEELDPEVEWRPVFQVMLGGEATVYWGHEGVREAFGEWYESLAEIHIEISETRDLGERIVTIGRFYARGTASGAEVESPGGWVVEFKNGKVVRVSEHLDRNEALAAAGLRE